MLFSLCLKYCAGRGIRQGCRKDCPSYQCHMKTETLCPSWWGLLHVHSPTGPHTHMPTHSGLHADGGASNQRWHLLTTDYCSGYQCERWKCLPCVSLEYLLFSFWPLFPADLPTAKFKGSLELSIFFRLCYLYTTIELFLTCSLIKEIDWAL